MAHSCGIQDGNSAITCRVTGSIEHFFSVICQTTAPLAVIMAVLSSFLASFFDSKSLDSELESSFPA